MEHMKMKMKDAHARFEGDLQRAVASLQDQCNSGLEMLRFGAGFTAPAQKTMEPRAASQPATATAPSTTAAPGSCTDIHLPHHRQQPQQPAAAYKCPRAATCKCARAVGAACAAKQPPARHPEGDSDLRLGLHGFGVDDLVASPAYGAAAGLATEPLAVLRDVLNLDGSRDREQPTLSDRGAATAAGAGGCSDSDRGGALLAQAKFESRLRGAYRSMLLQLQHRYQLERDRQEDVYRLALQEQEARHREELRQAAAAREEAAAGAARWLQRQEAAWRAEVQRLEAQLAAARTAADMSQSQAAAARAAAESLEAQLTLLRTTHEAEVQHVVQGSILLQEHRDIVARLQAEWQQALQQRERDYGALLTELAEMRQQLSSSAVGAPSRSSGSSCGRCPTLISPPLGGATGRPLQPPAAPAAGQHEHQEAPVVPARAFGRQRHTDDDPQAAESAQGRPAAADSSPREREGQTQEQPQQVGDAHDLQQRQSHNHNQRKQHQHGSDGFGSVQYVPVASVGGLRVRFDGGPCGGGGDGDGGGGSSSSSRPDSPAGSAHSAAAARCLDGYLDRAEAGARDASGPGHELPVRVPEEERPLPLPLPPPPPSPSGSSRLSDLVEAVVQHGGGAARRGLVVLARDSGAAGIGEQQQHPGMAEARGSGRTGNKGGGRRSGGEPLRGAEAGGGCAPQQQQQRQGGWGSSGAGCSFADWAPRGSGSGEEAGGLDGDGDGGAAAAPDSPELRNSEVTLDRWHTEAPRSNPQSLPRTLGDGLRGVSSSRPASPSQQSLHPGPAGEGGGVKTLADLRRVNQSQSPPPSPPRVPAARGRGDAARACTGAAAVAAAAGAAAARHGARSRSPSPSPPQRSPPRGRVGGGGGRGPAGGSSWGRSGNPAATLVLPRCLRCGLNDASSPGCCRFHPALMDQPGGLRFTPEWMTCRAAGHAAHTPGCLVRCEHFYETAGRIIMRSQQQQQRQQQQLQRPAAAAVGPPPRAPGPTTAVSAPRRGPEDENGGQGGEGAAVPWRGRRSSGGGAVAGAPLTAALAKAAVEAPRPEVSPARRGSTARATARARSPGRGALTAGGCGGDSPSPKPRTRLPSPMRR